MRTRKYFVNGLGVIIGFLIGNVCWADTQGVVFSVANKEHCSWTAGDCEELVEELKIQNQQDARSKCHAAFSLTRVTDFHVTWRSEGSGYAYLTNYLVTAAYRCGP